MKNPTPKARFLREYVNFLVERQNIWHRKTIEKEPAPWTKDPILKQGFFTNIYRELDRVTEFEIDSIVKTDLSKDEQFKRILILRHTNAIPLFHQLLKDPTVHAVADFRKTIPTNKFISDAIMFVPGRGWNRTEWVVHFYQEVQRIGSQVLSDISKSTNGQDCMGLLHLFPKMGPFRAYEVMTSLSYCKWFPYTENDFLTIGPGVPPTLSYWVDGTWDHCWGAGKKDIPDPVKYMEDVLPKIRDMLMSRKDFKWIPRSFQPNWKEDNKFTMRTLEHSCCEFRKYIGIKKMGKRVRRKY